MSAALITVDVDSVTPMIDEIPSAAVVQHVDEIEQRMFGLRIGLPRILNALRRHQVTATFFVPGIVAERSPETVASIVADGHEVGLHGWRHTTPRALGADQLRDDIARSLEALQRAGATDVRGYRAPEWHVTQDLLTALNATDLLYDSSLGGYETPYRLTGRTEPLVEVPVSWALDDALYFLSTSRSTTRPAAAAHVGAQWCRDIDAFAAAGAPAVLTIHPWIIGRAPALAALDTVLAHITSDATIWTGTIAELVFRTALSETPLIDPLEARSWWEER